MLFYWFNIHINVNVTTQFRISSERKCFVQWIFYFCLLVDSKWFIMLCLRFLSFNQNLLIYKHFYRLCIFDLNIYQNPLELCIDIWIETKAILQTKINKQFDMDHKVFRSFDNGLNISGNKGFNEFIWFFSDNSTQSFIREYLMF